MRHLTKRLLVGPRVNPQDSKGLSRLVDDMLVFSDGFKAVGQLYQICNLQTMFVITKRFIGRMLDDYTTIGHEYQKKHREAPGI